MIQILELHKESPTSMNFCRKSNRIEMIAKQTQINHEHLISKESSKLP